MKVWMWVSLDHATFGVAVDQRDGRVVEAAPIARWTLRRSWSDVLRYYLSR